MFIGKKGIPVGIVVEDSVFGVIVPERHIEHPVEVHMMSQGSSPMSLASSSLSIQYKGFWSIVVETLISPCLHSHTDVELGKSGSIRTFVILLISLCEKVFDTFVVENVVSGRDFLNKSFRGVFGVGGEDFVPLAFSFGRRSEFDEVVLFLAVGDPCGDVLGALYIGVFSIDVEISFVFDILLFRVPQSNMLVIASIGVTFGSNDIVLDSLLLFEEVLDPISEVFVSLRICEREVACAYSKHFGCGDLILPPQLWGPGVLIYFFGRSWGPILSL